MISTIEILTIIFVHWVADVVLQDESWAVNKSKSIVSLLSHTITYSVMWILVSLILFATHHFNIQYIINGLLFSGITFIAHTVTDYFTSKIVSKRFENKHFGSKIPNLGAFTVIGFDQILHYVQLILTYEFITKL